MFSPVATGSIAGNGVHTNGTPSLKSAATANMPYTLYTWFHWKSTEIEQMFYKSH
jgi:hypothetical protein